MDLLDKVKIGDLRALLLIRDGLSIECTGVVLKTSGNQIRDRLRRLESATGRHMYTHRTHSTNSPSRLTEAGYALANYADEVMQILEGAVDMVKYNAKQK